VRGTGRLLSNLGSTAAKERHHANAKHDTRQRTALAPQPSETERDHHQQNAPWFRNRPVGLARNHRCNSAATPANACSCDESTEENPPGRQPGSWPNRRKPWAKIAWLGGG
jgi:hypothetical protein